MSSVFVRGFDFGTTEIQIKKHCSKAGMVKSIEMWGKGAAVVTYASATVANSAVNSLNATTIPGNSRYLDVKLNEETQGQKRTSPGSARVFVRGFDFGTTDEQLEGHMSGAGVINKVQWCTKGAAIVTYSTKEEAETAVSTLNSTTIDGNSRFIDVILKEDDESGPPLKKFKGSSKGDTKGAKGGSWVFVPSDSFGASQVLGKLVSKVSGKSAGKGKGKGSRESDPPGSGRVFVRGFDFGTTDEQLLGHCGSVGKIINTHWCTKGSAILIYATKGQAHAAVAKLNGTTIPGNSRFLDLILKDSE